MTIQDFEKIVPDQGIRDFITNGIFDPFGDLDNFGRLYNNVVNLAFMYAFSCYHDLANRNHAENGGEGILEKCKRGGNSNSLRVIHTMEKVYSEYPITNELIQFVLLDIYFDFELGRNSRLKDYFPDCIRVGERQLNDFFPIINQSIGRSRMDVIKKLGRKTIHQMFLELLQMFPFLSTARLEFDEARKWYVFRIPSKLNYPRGIVNTFGSITRINEQEPLFFCLADIQNDALKYEKIGSKDYILCRLNAAEDNGYSEGIFQPPFELPIDEEYICSYLLPSKLEAKIQYKPAHAIEQLFNINYKYIKNLALAIADALGRTGFAECGNALRRSFASLYPDAFEKYNPELKNWDAVVLMLLIEASPSAVLQKVFYHGRDINEDIAVEIVENLRRRFGSNSVTNLEELAESGVLRAKAERAVKVRQLTLNAGPIKTRTYDYLHHSLVAESMANIILSAIADNNKKVSADSFYIGNTQQNIEVLEDLRNRNDPKQKCDGVRVAFGDLIKKIICFYEGIFSYGTVKLEYDKRSESMMLPAEDIRKYQEEAERAFLSAATKTFQRLSEMGNGSLLAILKEFLHLTEKCFVPQGNAYISKDNSHHLHTVLGKDAIMDADEFRSHVDIDRMEELNESNVDWWIEKAIEIIRFLRNGSFKNLGAETNLYAAITPLVASYNKGNDTRDGYHTAMFSLIIDSIGTEDQKKLYEINVLSEFGYNMSSKYYCLPNICRSTEKWWIDPFIIKCQIFDDIFEAR